VRPIPRGTHWTKPELVAQIGFAEWTNDARLRQPRFLGLRDDKPPQEVVRESPR
jgi:bifunctional non-homologous end joining protein LigD